MTTKICKKCNKEKDFACFSKASANKDGYVSLCKPCVVTRNRDYWRTPYGRISQIFTIQHSNSIVRGHLGPNYTKVELYNWALSNKLADLVEAWKESNYIKRLTPSVDRLVTTKGYALDNIRLVTWQENNDAQYAARKTCSVVTRQNRSVRQLALDGSLIAVHKSIASAARATGAVRTNINCMCTGKNPAIKSVSGFIWEYAD